MSPQIDIIKTNAIFNITMHKKSSPSTSPRSSGFRQALPDIEKRETEDRFERKHDLSQNNATISCYQTKWKTFNDGYATSDESPTSNSNLQLNFENFPELSHSERSDAAPRESRSRSPDEDRTGGENLKSEEEMISDRPGPLRTTPLETSEEMYPEDLRDRTTGENLKSEEENISDRPGPLRTHDDRGTTEEAPSSEENLESGKETNEVLAPSSVLHDSARPLETSEEICPEDLRDRLSSERVNPGTIGDARVKKVEGAPKCDEKLSKLCFLMPVLHETPIICPHTKPGVPLKQELVDRILSQYNTDDAVSTAGSTDSCTESVTSASSGYSSGSSVCTASLSPPRYNNRSASNTPKRTSPRQANWKRSPPRQSLHHNFVPPFTPNPGFGSPTHHPYLVAPGPLPYPIHPLHFQQLVMVQGQGMPQFPPGLSYPPGLPFPPHPGNRRF